MLALSSVLISFPGFVLDEDKADSEEIFWLLELYLQAFAGTSLAIAVLTLCTMSEKLSAMTC